MADWQVFAREPSPSYGTGPELPIADLKVIPRWLLYSTGVLETPYTEQAFELTAKGRGVTVYRDERQEFSGLVGSERAMGWDAQNEQPTIKVQLLGDDIHTADRLTFPDPARAGDDQTTADYWSFTGAASTAMWLLLDQQLGRSARPERRVPGLYAGDDPGAGVSRLWQPELFTPVLDACAAISASSGANLGVRVSTTVDGLRADVRQPRNLAAAVQFSTELGNLVGIDYRETPPDVTYALAAGQGDLRYRMRFAATSTSPADLAWGRRIERYVDRRDTADSAELVRAATDAIAQGVGGITLACSLADSDAARYSVDWGLGDIVTQYVGLPGQSNPAVVVDCVREIRFDVSSDGSEVITPAVGTADATVGPPSPEQQQLEAAVRRLAGLEARK